MNDLENFVRSQREWLLLEQEEEKAGLVDKLSALTAAECENEGLSLLSLEVDSVSTGLYGRTSVVVKRMNGNPMPSHSFKNGDMVKLYSPAHMNSKHMHSSSSSSSSDSASTVIEGVILKIQGGRSSSNQAKGKSGSTGSTTGVAAGSSSAAAAAAGAAGASKRTSTQVEQQHSRIEIVTDGDVDESFLFQAAPLRLDLLANDATYRKMGFALKDLEGISRGGTRSNSNSNSYSNSNPLVSLLFQQPRADSAADAITVTESRQIRSDYGSLVNNRVVGRVPKIRPFSPFINPSQQAAIENALAAPLLACK